MKNILLAALCAVFCGCDIIESEPHDFAGEATGAGEYTYCNTYTQYPAQVVEVDSTSSCAYSDSGTYKPVLIKASWFSAVQCRVMEPTDVIGGLEGITRTFGCFKEKPSNPVYRRNHLPCTDCVPEYKE